MNFFFILMKNGTGFNKTGQLLFWSVEHFPDERKKGAEN
jgi:hypothetical protein